jgi:hypothetical protein
MGKNFSPFAVVEIGGGIICLLIGVSEILQQNVSFTLILQLLLLGGGLLCYGLANNNTDKSERGGMLSNLGGVFMIIVGILSLYNYFYSSK